MFSFPGKHRFVRLYNHLHGDAPAKQHLRTGIERRLFLVAGQPYEVLPARGFRDLFHESPVRVLELRLNDECTQGLCHIPCPAGEQTCIFGLELIPRDAVSHLHPAVVRIHAEPHRLVEIKERLLGSVSWSVHGIYAPFNNRIQKNCKEN